MTSSEIYLPAQSELLSASVQSDFADLQSLYDDKLMYDWQWHALDGTVLVDYVARGDTAGGEPARSVAAHGFDNAMRDSFAAWARPGTDAFGVWTFDG